MTKLNYVFWYVVFVVVVCAFGTWLGLDVGQGRGDLPVGELSSFDWGDLLPFFGALMTFSIPNCGSLSLVFYVLTAGFIWCIIELIRGV
jgi:hypothetical protein